MISAKMQDAISQHVSAEFYSAYLYLSMSAYCESQVYKGFAKWLRIKHREEMGHAEKMLDYLLERGGQVKLLPIEAPPSEFASILAVFEHMLQHEQRVSQLILNLYGAAIAEN